MIVVVFHDFTNWFDLAVGISCLLQPLVLRALRHWRPDERQRSRRRASPMLVCLGAMLTVGGVSRMLDWTGVGLAVAFAVTVICAIGVIVFAIRSLSDRARGAGAEPGPGPGTGSS